MKRIGSKIFVLTMFVKLFGQTVKQTCKSAKEFEEALNQLPDSKPNCSPIPPYNDTN